MEENFKFKVNLGGMIDILSNHLYSSPNVFVRELLQNCVDAVSARIADDKNFNSLDAVIEIEVEQGRQITFRDSGTGLNEEEIHKFLAVIGQSSKYDLQNSRTNGDFIGRFGIGLLSCFMVTDSICVRTRSFKEPDTVLEWNGFADGTYTIEKIDHNMPIGTEIIIKNNKIDNGDLEIRCDDYFESETIENLVYYYGLFLQYPICMIVGDKRKRLNKRFSLDADENKEACLKAGKVLLGEDFLDCFNLTSESGLFEGVAYVIPYPVSAAVHNMHRIYLKNMLLTEDGGKLLPEWSFFVKCIINTNNLTPNSSREDFYVDSKLERACNEISDCITEYLEELDLNNKELLDTIVSIHNVAVKSVIASTDGLDDVLLPYVIFETSLGVMNGKEICEFGGNAYYTTDVNQFKQLAPLYTQRSMLLINAGYVYENAIIKKLAFSSVTTLIDKVTDTDIEFMLDDSEFDGEESAEKLCSFAKRILKKYDCNVAVKQFEPFDLPSLYTLNEQAEVSRRIKRSMESTNAVFMDILASFQDEIESKTSACLYFNTNNLIVRKMLDMEDNEKLRCYIEIIYVQSLLSGHFPLLHNEMKVLNENLYKLMEF